MSAPYYVNSNHLLVGPNVHYLPIAEASTQPYINPWSVILHSNAGPTKTAIERLREYMSRQDVNGESHLLVGLDGQIFQLLPFNRRADCNAHANSFDAFGGKAGAISFETQDYGYPSLPTTPWPMAQFDAIANACAALGHKYGIPYTSPTHWKDRGIGYHSQYPEWSIYKGKTCPGAARIRQMDYVRAVAANLCACE